MHELLWPALNLLVLIAVLFFSLRKAVPQMVAKRHETIKQEVEEALAQKHEAERKFNEFQKKLEVFEKEANTVVEQARKDGEAVKTKIIENSKLMAEKLIKDTESAIQIKIEETKYQIRSEVISEAVKIAEKEIRNRISSEDQRRIVNEFKS